MADLSTKALNTSKVNIADSFLTAGALVVFIDIFKRRK